MTQLSIGDIIEVVPERIAYGGDAVTRFDGLAVFVPFAAPGDRLRVRIVERQKRYARAVIEEVLTPSPERRERRCPHFGECGGCQLQHLNYEAQVRAKAAFVRDSLERIGGIKWDRSIPIITGPEFGYRSRARFQIDPAQRTFGFHRAKSNIVCNVTTCPILVPALQEQLPSIREAVQDAGAATVVQVAAGDAKVTVRPRLDRFSDGAIIQTVAGKHYRTVAGAFFQANPFLIDQLVAEVTAGEEGTLAIDLYAGVGLFTIPLAEKFSKVVGVEADREAAFLANRNALLNNARNVEILRCRIDTASGRLGGASPDLIVLDPPRTGAPEALALIQRLSPRRIVYVSCDPVTLARDLRVLLGAGFELVSLKGLDLFPQTYHVEAVARLKAGPDGSQPEHRR
jgi:23S rRNA (uracil1939-C5)-methyltransferase